MSTLKFKRTVVLNRLSIQKNLFISFLGFLNLSKNDCIQQGTAESNKIPLFIEMCDQYPLVYNILWALSFNQNIQEQLRSSSIFMSKLGHLSQECDSEEMRKVVHGILWNLEINHDEHPTSVVNDGITFDIMISYSHKDKIFCKQIYEELTKAGYRVWIDFDQMHGNVMDAMAQAIERSHIVIICMSEEYRNSNYCRAEAHYAFQRQRKIVPVLLQEHYRPDGWLLFLIGQVLYVDFTKYDFSPAMTMLFEELKSPKNAETKQTPVRLVSIPKASSASILPQNMLEWTSAHVQAWLTDHNLEQMACLLENCNGRSLVYLNKYIKTDSSVLILKLLQTDSLRRTGQDLSLIELSSFRALMDEQKQFISSTVSMRTKTNNDKKIS